ncbi:hypothetical protein [Ruania albidiflava]|uniref:hypothetical protein n=1 Tax=Ruania albidiflava TaxID=366586 RepID=UPI0023F19EB9|nr:hypothetical protein [Ruania albidiflava]
MYPTPTIPLAEHARRARLTGLWAAGTGLAALLLVAVLAGTTFGLVRVGGQLTGPSGGGMFHGGEVFFAWAVTNALAVVGIVLLGVAALVLDIVMLTKLRALRAAGAATAVTRPLEVAVLTGSGLVSTPVGLLLLLVPNIVLGPGAATHAVLVVLLALMLLVPIVGRIVEGVLSRRLPRDVTGHGVGARPHAPSVPR